MPVDERRSLAVRERLLADAAPADLDVAAAAERVELLRRARRRTRRGASGVLAVLALVALAVLVWPSDDDPDQLLADRTEPTTTTTSPRRSTTTAAPTTVAAAIVVPSTSAPTTSAAPPSSVAPPTSTTLPPNQPMQARLRLPSDEVAPGEAVTLEVDWVDADHSGVQPRVEVDWGDPALTQFSVSPLLVGCDRPGSSGGGVIPLQYRFATPGLRTVRVKVTTCSPGQGAYGEQLELVGTVRVSEPRYDDRPGRVVLAVQVDGRPAPSGVPPLDAATATFVPSDATSPTLELAAREPVLAQVHTSPTLTGLATVLVLPADAVGTLELSWPGSDCRGTAEVLSSSEPVLALALPVTC
jgi:hypothetical protein